MNAGELENKVLRYPCIMSFICDEHACFKINPNLPGLV